MLNGTSRAAGGARTRRTGGSRKPTQSGRPAGVAKPKANQTWGNNSVKARSAVNSSVPRQLNAMFPASERAALAKDLASSVGMGANGADVMEAISRKCPTLWGHQADARVQEMASNIARKIQ